MPPGTLFLVPNSLDFGTSDKPPDLRDVLPHGVLVVAARLTHWVAENAKTTRAFLKRVDAIVPLEKPLQLLSIVELPRPRKGAPHAAAPDFRSLLAPAMQGDDLGLISEAGLPAVADPGAQLVRAAHEHRIAVVALPGPSSLLLALAASGLDGQSFQFVGYLPVDAAARSSRIRELEAASRQRHQTQIVIETPYRNANLLAALLDCLQPETRLSVSCGLTLPTGGTRSATVRDWPARHRQPLPADVPAVFSFLVD